MRFLRIVGLAVLLALGLAAGPAAGRAGAKEPSWWLDAKAEAERYGYAVADTAEVRRLLSGRAHVLALDVRPDYEFAQGSLHFARNFEFDLADAQGLSEARQKALFACLGRPTDTPVVVFCRGVFCVRSAIAARELVRLGFTRVVRYPEGYAGLVAAGLAGPERAGRR